MQQPKLIHYRVTTSGGNVFPGAHPGSQPGQGFVFREHDTLIRAQEHRRIDIHATLKNPFGEIMVRTFNQKSAIPVQIIADISASIMTPGAANKVGMLVEAISSLGYSAYRHGDKFSLIACNDRIDPSLLMPPSSDVSNLDRILPRLEQAFSGGSSALPECGKYISVRRGLAFLISDFLFSRKILDTTLQILSRQTVIPVILRERDVTDPMQNFGSDTDSAGKVSGLITYVDSETGRRQKIFMRRTIRYQYRENVKRYYGDLERYLLQKGLRPLVLAGSFDADRVSRYFHP